MKRVMLFATILAVLLAGCVGEDAAPPSAVTLEPTVPVPTDAPTPSPSPTAIPTPSPTPSPTPIPDAALDAGALDAMFDCAVFIGDSLTRNLHSYVIALREEDPDFLGGAQFIASHNYSLRGAVVNNAYYHEPQLRFRGAPITLINGVLQSGAKRVYLMLGKNDMIGFNVDLCYDYYMRILDDLRGAAPDVEIVLEGITPVLEPYLNDRGKVYNDNLKVFCERIEAFCEQTDGVYYLDLFSALVDDNGCLRAEWCSDGGMHLNHDGEDVWIRLLRSQARDMLESGVWTMPEPAAGESCEPTAAAG